MNIEHQYLNVLKELLQISTQPHQLKSDRTGTGTYGKFGHFMEHDMSMGFPLLTTKRVHFKSILSELLWFMRGQSDVRTLLKQNNTIWVGDAYKKYSKIGATADQKFNKWMRTNDDGSLSLFTRDQFIDQILTNDEFSKKWGQLGPGYGPQWRGYDNNRNPDLVDYLYNESDNVSLYKNVDQLDEAIWKLRNTPNDRRIIVSSWDPETLHMTMLPPCHNMFQFGMNQMSNQEKKANPGYHQKLSLMWNQRSSDTLLGIPFNIGSYATLLEIVSRMVPGTKADKLKCSHGDIHLYSDHIEAAKIQVNRQPLPLPTLVFDDNINFSGTLDEMLKSITDPFMQIQVNNYSSHSKIVAPLSN